MKLEDFFHLLKASFKRWNEEKGPRLGAALSYYTAFSLSPLILLAIAIEGLFFGKEAVRGQIVSQLTGLLGTNAAETLQEMIKAAQKPVAGTIATVISVIMLLVGASGVTLEMRDALSHLWDVPVKPGLRSLVRTHLKAMSMVLAIGFILLVSLFFSTAVSAFGKYFVNHLPFPAPLLQVFDLLTSFVMITLLFATLFKFLPDARVRWHDVWAGSFLTTGLFVIGKYALGLYLGKGVIGSAYGTAGSVLIMMMWVYYSAQIFYFGAAYTKVYADRYGAGVKPQIKK